MEGLEINVLQACRSRKYYTMCVPFFKVGILEPDAMQILKMYRVYFKKFKSVDIIKGSELIAFLQTLPKSPGRDKTTLFLQSNDDIEITDEFLKDTLKHMTETKFFANVFKIIEEVNSLEGIENPIASVRYELETTLDLLSKVDVGMLDVDTLDQVMEDEDKFAGLTWLSKGMNELVHTLLKGRFIVVAATTDAGKTTFLLNEMLNFAKQLTGDEKIIWFNNEEKTSALRKRLMQAVLECTEYDLEKRYKLSEDGEKPVRYDTTKLTKDVNKAAGFDLFDRFMFMNAHSANHIQIEQELKQHNCRIVVFDMLDHIKYISTDKHHLDVEEKYKWARNLAAIHNCTVFASSQVSQEGQSMREPPMTALKESKTGKQATTDLLIFIGWSAEQMDNEALVGTNATYRRYLTVPKNKMANHRVKRDDRDYADQIVNRVPLYIEADKCKFIDQADYNN